MKRYRRVLLPGGTFFFTVVTYRRAPWLTEPDAIERLRRAIRTVRARHPFAIDAIVILPDHLHAIWTLPAGDGDFPMRWRLIKHGVAAGRARGWRWQPRYWEHVVRDDRDWRAHMDYIHYNPVKHGHAPSPAAWPWSSFHRAVRNGLYPPTWGASEPADPAWMTGEPAAG